MTCRDFVNTRLLVHKHVKISVDKWIWKPLVHKNMSNFWNNIFHKFSIPKSNFERQENEKCCIVLAFPDTFQPCWPCLLWTFCKLCSDWASFTKQLSESSYWICLELLPPSERGSFQTKKTCFRSFKSLKITK